MVTTLCSTDSSLSLFYQDNRLHQITNDKTWHIHKLSQRGTLRRALACPPCQERDQRTELREILSPKNSDRSAVPPGCKQWI